MLSGENGLSEDSSDTNKAAIFPLQWRGDLQQSPLWNTLSRMAPNAYAEVQ